MTDKEKVDLINRMIGQSYPALIEKEDDKEEKQEDSYGKRKDRKSLR